MRTLLLGLAAFVSLAGAPAAEGQAPARGEDGTAERIATRYVALAGSQENALALVLALRNGERVTLVSDAEGSRVPTTTVFELPTGRMGWDEVNISLALAKDSLVKAGVPYPTAQELESALVGGEVVGLHGKAMLRGVLTTLADGIEWRQIRHARAGAVE